MSGPMVTNWFGDIVSHPQVIVDAHSVADIIEVMKDPAAYPSPVRAVGSNHSTTPCGTADGGTLIRMKMNRILDLKSSEMTVEAGAVHLDMAKELERHTLQFYVNTEIGSLSAGSAACAGTKDASMPGEFGQVGSYITGIKMVLANGELLNVTEEANPELMQIVRSSYGTMGIVYEVTFRVRPLVPVRVFHETFRIQEFIDRLPELKARKLSMMFYIFPATRRITVEFRSYNPAASGKPNRSAWDARNRGWGRIGPRVVRLVDKYVSSPQRRYAFYDTFHAIWRFTLEHQVKSGNTLPADQIIRYPPVADESRYTFSLFAFPEDVYPKVLTEFCDFCDAYQTKTGYRSNLIDVGYYIAQDRNALLSYSYDSAVMTIDPVSTGESAWRGFLHAYNQFSSDHGGLPLFNQTFGASPEIARKAFGARLTKLAGTQKTYDPEGRLLNEYFRNLFATALAAAPGE